MAAFFLRCAPFRDRADRGVFVCVLSLFVPLQRIVVDQSYLKKRQQRHEQTLASSDRRAVAWTLLEVLVLGVLSCLQMVFFRRAFKNY